MRGFFCLELSDEVKACLAEVSYKLKDTPARVNWVRPELLHITLKYLGEIDVAQTVELQSVAQQVAQPHGPFSLTLDALGVFPSFDRPRVVWAGASRVPPALVTLQAALDACLVDQGFPPERHFTPHVTFGRVKDGNPNHLSALSQRIQSTPLEPVEASVNGVTLMESVLGGGGPRYTPLFKIAL